MNNLKTLGYFYHAFEYFVEVDVLLKKEGPLKSGSPEQQKMKLFFEIYCDDCLDGSEVAHDFRVAER